VLNDFVLVEDAVENLQRAAAVDHEIFGDDLKPVADRLARQDVVVVRSPEADADPIVGESVESIRWHFLIPV